jgi:formylglycine-generating enzyme
MKRFYFSLHVLIFLVPILLSAQTSAGTMAAVAGGSFTAGSTPVTIGSFKMDTYEVTYELWTEIRNWGLVHGYTDLAAGNNGCNPAGSNNPVSDVNWYESVKWCNARSEKNGFTPVYYTDSTKSIVYRTGEIDINRDAVKWTANGYRLPTECEWEYAARGGNRTHGCTYSGSNTIDSVAWYRDNSDKGTHPVGQKNANELGLFDMSGNIEEWCWDWYTDVYPSGSSIDPKGPASTQSSRVLRGGPFRYDGIYCRVNFRNHSVPNFNYYGDNGFRCLQN